MKTCLFVNQAELDFQEGPGRAPKRVLGALAGSQGALGASVQLYGALWGGAWVDESVTGPKILR